MSSAPSRTNTICYLCGAALAGRLTDRDHVPPRQIFPPSLRKKHSPALLTLKVHRDCHAPYGRDEDYFVQAVGPIAHGTAAGRALFHDTILATIRQPDYGPRISRKVLGEFALEINGIWLPPGTVAKRFEPDRVYRVIWKIIRGFHFHERELVLPESHLVKYRIYSEEDPPQLPLMQPLLSTTPRILDHPGVFTYWRLEQEIKGNAWHAWALLFWDAVMFFAIFHEPSCPCDQCTDFGDATAT